MAEFDYATCRKEEAAALGVSVITLDREVKRVQIKAREQRPEKGSNPFTNVEPWHEPVDGAELLDETRATILRFCVLPPHSAEVMAAWVLHAWAHDAADISPILAFVSPEKRCGKTTALSVIRTLVPRALQSANITPAVLFRVVEEHAPTLLIDEADTFLGENSELRGILNGGHNRLSAYVWRCDGEDNTPRAFKVWTPKVIAMIGQLPDTLEDRSLVVPLRRKHESETVERFRAGYVEAFEPLRRRAQRWAGDHLDQLKETDPEVPSELNDRAQDNARPLCAVADAAGDEWPDLIRTAFTELAQASKAEEPQSPGVLLLRDIAGVMDAAEVEQMRSSELLDRLLELPEAPWLEYRHGKPLTTRRMADLLKPFGVEPVRGSAGSFYHRHDLADALARYLPEGSLETAISATTAMMAEAEARGFEGF